jgi:hypothetical protein
MTNQYAIDQEAFDELAEMALAVWRVIDAEPDAKRAKVLNEIFCMFGEILADVERTPITLIALADPRV